MIKKIVIIGASSAIAEAVARHYASQGCILYLIARNEQRLKSMVNDLKLRGASEVLMDVLDVDHFSEHNKVVKKAIDYLKQIDVLLIAHGVLPDQKSIENNVEKTLASYHTNALSIVSFLTLFTEYFEHQQQGTITVITSVAGDRGRQSNYIYGSAKAMLSVFLEGLRNRLFKSNVNVLDIKPGFVDTPMVAHLKKGLLWAKPENVASDLVKAIEKKKSVLYTPFFWRYIMLIIRHIPECLFKRGNL